MIRIHALPLLAVAGAALGAAPAAGQTVNIYNWSDYIGETTLADFTAATGIETVYDVYDSNDVLEAKLLAGNSGYDIVVPTSTPYFVRQVEAGLLRELDRSQIPNWSNLDPQVMAQLEAVDPGNRYGVPYQGGTDGFGYNVGMILERMPDAPVDSWAMIFDPEVVSHFADCGVSILDAGSDVFPLALNYLGLDPNSEDSDDLAQAEALLMSIRPYIRYFHSSQYINDLANGDICLAIGYSGDIIQAQMRAEEAGQGVEIAYTIAKEGTVAWWDMLAIPADAPHPGAAHAFINFVLQPEVMAGISNYVAYPNAVPGSLPLLDEEIRTDPTIYPPPEVQARLFTVGTVSPRTDRERTRAWTRIRTGQ